MVSGPTVPRIWKGITGTSPRTFGNGHGEAKTLVLHDAGGQTNRFVSRIGGELVIAQLSLTCSLLIASLLQVKSIAKWANTLLQPELPKGHSSTKP